MSEKGMDIYEFQKMMREKGISDDSIDSFTDGISKKLHVLPFLMDSKGANIVSHIKGIITFVDSRFLGKVEVGDVWICTAEAANNVYYATPLFKVTSSFLLNLDQGLRIEMRDSLWARNRNMFVDEFEQKYKDEVIASTIETVKKEFEDIIADQKVKIQELEDQLNQSRLLIASGEFRRPAAQETIELGSEEEQESTVELASESHTVSREETVAPVDYVHVIPKSYDRAAPGIPAVRVPEHKQLVQKKIVYKVERFNEETLYSESFTELRYFVHISPDCKMLVIRPNEYGSALCINKKIRLKGLGKLSPCPEPKNLMAEYSSVYEGMIVYL